MLISFNKVLSALESGNQQENLIGCIFFSSGQCGLVFLCL